MGGTWWWDWTFADTLRSLAFILEAEGANGFGESSDIQIPF